MDLIIINFLNKQPKWVRSLLIINKKDDLKITINENIDVIESEYLLDFQPKKSYHIISSWDILSSGQSIFIYSCLSKMNHILADYGKIYLRVPENIYHLKDFDDIPFCWNSERINSFGKSKGLKVKDNKIHRIKNKRGSFLRFMYVPAI